MKKNKGITLVALVVTIVVLIILATISIKIAIGNKGIINKAELSKDMTSNSTKQEEEDMNRLVKEYENMMIEMATAGGEIKTPIDKETSYIGYYADINGDKEPDGIIYADLAVGRSGQWGNSNGTYSYDAISGVKDYYVSKTGYEGTFGTADVLTATGEGADRFYVMALNNITTGDYSSFYWYKSAYEEMSDYSEATSTAFGTGKANTSAMIDKWNKGADGGYGTQDAQDMWGVIQSEVAKGWFVPSSGEWSAFADAFGITSSNYGSLGLSDYYWSSSQRSTYHVWITFFSDDCVSYNDVLWDRYVRLSATF